MKNFKTKYLLYTFSYRSRQTQENKELTHYVIASFVAC